ncbi:MAG: hypothetical protein HY258_04700 [Chloroflexi bacterium]|nr:hypothetical protein [Chloroflexota bacterium]
MRNKSLIHFVLFLLIAALACNLPFITSPSTQAPNAPPALATVPTTAADTVVPPSATNTPILHIIKPADIAPTQGAFVYDVDSSGTAPEKRAPYGDSYDIDRFERPFLQDMTYIQNLDILNFNLTKDDTWYYTSMATIGNDPNDSHNIDYGVEIDLNHDGFGDYLIWAQPPYTPPWSTTNVKVFADKNHDTGGLSGEKSDAPISGDGYETLVFDGNTGAGTANDPDLAWVRVNAGKYATVQFALKRSLIGSSFMLGVLADAGLKDPGKFDYNDRFTEAEAGSPIKNKQYYPLKALYEIDNTCWEAFGFKPTGYEPKLCPREEPKPQKTPSACEPPPYCHPPDWYWYGEPVCYCQEVPG